MIPRRTLQKNVFHIWDLKLKCSYEISSSFDLKPFFGTVVDMIGGLGTPLFEAGLVFLTCSF